MSDLIKATVVCGGIAFMVYSYPVISQVAIIGLLCEVIGDVREYRGLERHLPIIVFLNTSIARNGLPSAQRTTFNITPST